MHRDLQPVRVGGGGKLILTPLPTYLTSSSEPTIDLDLGTPETPDGE